MKRSMVLLLGVILAFAGANMLFQHDAQQGTFNKLAVGMPKSEVRQLLGGPLATPDRARQLRTGEDEEIWLGQDGAIIVTFKRDSLIYLEWVEPEAVNYLTGFSQ